MLRIRELRSAPVLLTAALLAWVGWRGWSAADAADAEPHHSRVRAAAAAWPLHAGDWSGTEVPTPPAAVALLRPNAMHHRRYVNARNGRHASLLVVQCRDARDMVGHYPPVCYPAHGWALVDGADRSWRLEGLTVSGREYRFERHASGRTVRMAVADFLVLPDGRTTGDMGMVSHASADYLRRHLGAGQVQLVMDGDVPQQERDEAFRSLVGSAAPLVRTMGSEAERKKHD